VDRFRRNATLLWTGQLVSQMGDAVFTSALVWLATSVASRESGTGLVVFLYAVPFLVLGPLAGALVDRVDRRRLMIASDVLRAAVLFAFVGLAHASGLTYGLLVGAALLTAAASTPFLPARDALIPRLAEGRPLVRFNASFQTSGQLAQIAGLWLGGLLLGEGRDDVGRVLGVVAIDAATFFASAVTLALLVLPPAPPAPAKPRARLHREALEGLRDASRDPLLLGLLVLTALDNVAIMGPAIVGAAHFVRDDLGLGAAHLAWFEGAMALGYLLGAVVLGRFGTRWPSGVVLLVGITMDGATYVPVAFAPDYTTSLALIVLHGAFIPCIVVSRTAILQRAIPPERAGRAFALVHLTVVGMTAVSALLAGAVGDAFGPRTLFLAAGVFGTLCGLAGFAFLPRLRDRTES
jgi:MFS family permease